jgi:glycosyltransferase involved in cell wall biosynthesis
MEQRNIHIVQAVIPKYRVPFFNQIIKKTNNNYFFYTSKDFKGYPSTAIEEINFHITFFKINSFFNIFFWFIDFKLLKNVKKGDIIVLEGNLRFLDNYKIFILSKFLKCKIIWWSIYDMPYSSKVNKLLREFFMHFVDYNIVYTEKEYLNFTTKYKYFKNISYLNNTIDISKFKQNKQISNEVKEFKNNILRNKNVLIYCGRLTKKPKLEIVFQFLKNYDFNNKFHFIIIGDGEEKTYLKNLSIKYKIENKVSFIGSIYNEEILSQYFVISHLFVYPGSVGLSLFTAFANHLPVLTHNKYHYQAPEFYAIENGFNSILFKYFDLNDFSEKVKYYFEDTIKINIMKENAFYTVNEKYTIDKMSNNFIRALNLINE